MLYADKYAYNNKTAKPKTKKAWRRFFKRHRDWCVYIVKDFQFYGDEIPMKPIDFLNMLIKEKRLVAVNRKGEM